MMSGNPVDVYLKRAISHFINKEYAEAEFFYKKICHQKPNDNSWLSRGLCFKFMKMYESAVYCFVKALGYESNESNECHTYYHLGHSLLSLQRYDRGMNLLDKAIELSPDFELPYYMKSIASRYKLNYS